MANLTQDQKKIAIAWLHDIAIAGDMLPIADTKRFSGYSYMYGNPYYAADVEQYSKTIWQAILDRNAAITTAFDFEPIDKALIYLSRIKFSPELSTDPDSIHRAEGKPVHKRAEILAKYLAQWCAANGIFWDDSKKTKYEMEHYVSNTLMGKALWEANAFYTQQAAKMKAKASTRTRTNVGTTSSSGSSSGAKIGYKQSGAHSDAIPNLIGSAGNKVYLQNTVFCVLADKAGGKNTPFAYITPLKALANSGIATVDKTSAETVKMASANGYTDCVCWFDNITDASAFEQKVQAKFGNKYTNIRCAKSKPDKNGYFKVSTEFGDAYIKASALNEALKATVLENPDIDEAEQAYFEAYQEAFIKYE